MTKTMTDVHNALDIARAEAREAFAERRKYIDRPPALRPKLPPLPLVAVLGDSGTGKGTIIAEYLNRISETERWPDGKQLVVSFELSVDATPKALHSDFLEATEDPDPTTGTNPGLSRRVRMQTANLNTELGICDETQHVVGSDTETRNKSVADTFKKFLNHNTSALALFGTKNAERIFDANNELVQRTFLRFDIDGARIHVEEERLEFFRLLKEYSEQLVRLGIIDSAKILVDQAIVGTTFTQCKGRYGTAGRLIKNAVRIALMEGAHTLLPHHMFKAVSGSRILFDDDSTNYFENYGAAT